MTPRTLLPLLAAAALLATTGLSVGTCPPPGVVNERLSLPGYPEPDTPGAPGVVASERVQQILGPDPDLNRVTIVRTHLPGTGVAPRAVVILIPGFLGGATTFGPLAEDLVRRFGGALEVWAVDRRPNQLEDRRGSLHAQDELATNPDALLEGARFYFGGDDLDGDGSPDPAFPLPDALDGTPRPAVILEQDDVRFMAHWGLDTYVRDWRILAERARDEVGPGGVVVIGGHSQGTTFSSIFTGYDFDPGPGVDAGFEHVDGLLLLEGGGVGPPSNPPTPQEYRDGIAALADPGGPPVYLPDIGFGIDPVGLGYAAEIAGIAGFFRPGEPALLQRTSFGQLLRVLIPADTTNQGAIAFFIDDDFSPNAAFRASVGFSDDGPNTPLATFDAYQVRTPPGGGLRTWKDFDDPTLPSVLDTPPCDPAGTPFGSSEVDPGCAIVDNGPEPGPGEPERQWGLEREVTALNDLVTRTFARDLGNFSEWYFSVRAGQFDGFDLRFGADSSSLGDESLLAITQMGNVDVPVLAVGGSNGLAPTAESWDTFFSLIATPPADREVAILEGYAHLDPLTAFDNEATPFVQDWVNRLLQRKLIEISTPR